MNHRATFLSTATAARNLIATDDVAARWDDASALRKMTVGDVAAHLGRAIVTVDRYLTEIHPTQGERVDAVGYFLAFRNEIGHDIDTELNQAVRRRAVEASASGHATVLENIDNALERLARDLETAPTDMDLSVLGGVRISLDDYLVTRLVELVVHTDDLAVSVGLETPSINERGLRIAIAALVDMARRAHGDIAVMRALARRERDTAGALPVL